MASDSQTSTAVRQHPRRPWQGCIQTRVFRLSYVIYAYFTSTCFTRVCYASTPGHRIRQTSCTGDVCALMQLGVWLFVGLFWLLRVGVWFGFVGSALLLAVGTCVILSFEAMPGFFCFLRVTPGLHVCCRAHGYRQRGTPMATVQRAPSNNAQCMFLSTTVQHTPQPCRTMNAVACEAFCEVLFSVY